jgi:hypothetical protein
MSPGSPSIPGNPLSPFLPGFPFFPGGPLAPKLYGFKSQAI